MTLVQLGMLFLSTPSQFQSGILYSDSFALFVNIAITLNVLTPLRLNTSLYGWFGAVAALLVMFIRKPTGN